MTNTEHRILFFLNQHPDKEVREMAIRQYDRRNNIGIKAENIESLSDAIAFFNNWFRTDEGRDYWHTEWIKKLGFITEGYYPNWNAYEGLKDLLPLPNVDFGEVADLKPLTKCYISGKITGIENKANELFEKGCYEAEKLGLGNPVNPMTLPHDHDKSWINFMKEDVKAMLDCENVYMLNNWKDSKGATIEHDIAKSLGLNIVYQP